MDSDIVIYYLYIGQICMTLITCYARDVLCVSTQFVWLLGT